MQNEMKSAVKSPKNRYNASSVFAAAAGPAAAATVEETVSFEAYANKRYWVWHFGLIKPPPVN